MSNKKSMILKGLENNVYFSMTWSVSRREIHQETEGFHCGSFLSRYLMSLMQFHTSHKIIWTRYIHHMVATLGHLRRIWLTRIWWCFRYLIKEVIVKYQFQFHYSMIILIMTRLGWWSPHQNQKLLWPFPVKHCSTWETITRKCSSILWGLIEHVNTRVCSQPWKISSNQCESHTKERKYVEKCTLVSTINRICPLK